MDQTPLFQEFMDKRTYEMKGARTVWLKEARSGWDKRQATLQICIFADGIARCKPQLIFHGKETGGKVRKLERAEMHSGVDVLYNEKGYANEKTMVYWLKHVYSKASASQPAAQEPRLLVLDAFSAHLTEDVRAEMTRLQVSGSYIPGGCTGYVQPLDVAINQPLKGLIKKLADIHREDNREEYATGKYRIVRNRRILLTHLVAKAWDQLHLKYKPTIVQSFRRVGLSLNPDGSEDAKIQIKGVEDMVVEDWAARDSESLTQEEEEAMEMMKLVKVKTPSVQEPQRAETGPATQQINVSDSSDDELSDMVLSAGEEGEDEVMVASAPAATTITRKRKHGWDYVNEPEKWFEATVIEGGRGRGRKRKEFFTAEEASDGHESEGWIELE